MKNETKPIQYTEKDKLNWEVEKLRLEIINLSRSHYIAVASAVISGVLGLAAVGYQLVEKITNIGEQQKERERIEKEITSLQEKKENIIAEQDAMTARFNLYSQELHSILTSPSSSTEDKIQQIQKISPLIQYAAPESNSTIGLPARIYLQYPQDQEGSLSNTIKLLGELRYKVKSIPKSKVSRDFLPVVAYYYDSDKEEAEKIIEFLKVQGFKNIRPTPVKVSGSARPRHFDVFISLP